MKKNNEFDLPDSAKKVDVAEEYTYKIAKTLLKAYDDPSITAETKDEIIVGAGFINETIKALNSESPIKNIADIPKNFKKDEVNQKPSGLLTNIKEFIKSIIHLLTSRFTTKNVEEVRKSADKTIQAADAIIDDKAAQKPTSPLSSIENHSSSKVITEGRARSSSIASAPPSPPPLPIAKSHTSPITEGRDTLLAEIRKGKQLKKVEERKSSNSTKITSQDPQATVTVIDELTMRLKARRVKLGDSSETASQYAKDAKLFEQARREEAERQERIEQSENIRVAAAKDAEQKAKSLEIKSSPRPINIKRGEIPLPPPLPPSSSSVQVKENEKSPLKATKGSSKNGSEPQQMIVSKTELNKVLERMNSKGSKRLQLLIKDDNNSKTGGTDFQSSAKKKQKLGPNTGYSK